MKLVYAAYFITSIFITWVILLYLGVSAGFASYIPVVALFSCITLFVAVLPLIVYKAKAGLIVGSICCLLIIPYVLGFTYSIFDEEKIKFDWKLLLILLPIIVISLSAILTVRNLWFVKLKNVITNKFIKVIMAALPPALFVLYVVLYLTRLFR